MVYTKTTWINGGTPAIDAAHLQNIEDGLTAVDVTATANTTALATKANTSQLVATAITSTPTTRISATTVQAALSSIDTLISTLTAAGVSFTPVTGISSTTTQGAIATLASGKLDATAVAAVNVVVALAGETPTTGEGLDGDLGRTPDGYYFGPKVAGVWPTTAHTSDVINGATTTITGVATFSGAVHAAANSRTGTVTITGNSTPTQLCDATTAAFTITLPSTPVAGWEYTIIKTDSSTNVVTVAAGSAGALNGGTTLTLTAQYKYIRALYTGANWVTVGSN